MVLAYMAKKFWREIAFVTSTQLPNLSRWSYKLHRSYLAAPFARNCASKNGRTDPGHHRLTSIHTGQDGDSQIDGVEFQPLYEDDVEDVSSALSEISGLLRKASEQEQSLTKDLAFLSQEVGTEIAQTEALKKEVEELRQLQKEMYDTDSLKPGFVIIQKDIR